jgi:predicted aconitase with swiveling domain
VSSAGWTAEARALLAGTAEGAALALDEPLSFWGGIEIASGRLVDPHHPQLGAVVAGTVLVLPSGRGSSSSSSVLAECLHAGTGPAAILLHEPDRILLLGALVAAELGGPVCPVVVLGAEGASRIRTGDRVRVRADGTVEVA